MGFVLKTALGTKSRTVDSLDVCCPLDKYHLHLLINTFPHPVHKLARGVTFRHHFYLDYWQEGRWERNRGVAALFLTHLPIYIHIYTLVPTGCVETTLTLCFSRSSGSNLLIFIPTPDSIIGIREN